MAASQPQRMPPPSSTTPVGFTAAVPPTPVCEDLRTQPGVWTFWPLPSLFCYLLGFPIAGGASRTGCRGVGWEGQGNSASKGVGPGGSHVHPGPCQGDGSQRATPLQNALFTTPGAAPKPPASAPGEQVMTHACTTPDSGLS